MAPVVGLTWLVVAANLVLAVAGEIVPFLHPGFFFSYSKLPVTQQCESVSLVWGRNGATGPNPVAPYFFQIFTSSFIVPFIIEAGDGADAGNGDLSFDFTVPFAPGTQYQICMYDSLGTPGGCQMLYTMIANTTVANPTCQNMTFPAESNVINVTSTVDGGQLSQDGFVNQCDDISIKPNDGTPPFILTISPPNHPPYNMTSNTMDPILWTVSLSRAFPFFVSLVSSEGKVWAFGPMGVGASDVDACLAPDTILKTKAHAVAAGAAVGGIFGGLFLIGAVYLFTRYWPRQSKYLITPWLDNGSGSSSGRSSSNVSSGRSDGDYNNVRVQIEKPRLDSLAMNDGITFNNVGYGFSPNSQPTPVSTIYPQHSASQLFVRHQDGGRIPMRGTLFSDGTNRMFSRSSLEMTQEVIELPPDYVGRTSEEEQEEQDIVAEGSRREHHDRFEAIT